MRYGPKIYARAVLEATEAAPQKRDEILKRFVRTVRKNGDQAQFGKIIAEAERIERAKAGGRKITLETAREVSPEAKRSLLSFIGRNDDVEERLVPELVAGARITIDDERQWDGSLARKLKSIFKI